jgi:hypothetical protein
MQSLELFWKCAFHGVADRSHVMVCDQRRRQATMLYDPMPEALHRVDCSTGLPSVRDTCCRHLAVSATEAAEACLTLSAVVVMAPDGTLFHPVVVITHQHAGCKLAHCHGHTGEADFIQEPLRPLNNRGMMVCIVDFNKWNDVLTAVDQFLLRTSS